MYVSFQTAFFVDRYNLSDVEVFVSGCLFRGTLAKIAYFLTFSLYIMVFVAVPYPLVLTSENEGAWPYEYTVSWEKPKTGGLPIREYEFKFRRVRFPVITSVFFLQIVKLKDSVIMCFDVSVQLCC